MCFRDEENTGRLETVPAEMVFSGQAVGPSRVTPKLCCFETSRAGREAHRTLFSLHHLYVVEQGCVTLAGGSRARQEAPAEHLALG